MKTASRDKPAPNPLGQRIRALRLNRRLSLAQLAQATGVSEATLSRIEVGQSQVTAPHLHGLAQQLGVDVSSFFVNDIALLHPGFRALNRADQGDLFETPRLTARLKAGELLNKRMHPFVNRVTAQTLEQAGGLRAHAGEEYLHVLSGPLVLHSAGYAALVMQTGDSLYFDAGIPHAYVAGSVAGASFLVVSSHPAPDDLEGNNDGK
jgi:transcriptional regulator with XRE-family HTH domain